GLLRRTGWRNADLQAFRRSRARQNQFVREFKRAGGLIAAGSDAANQLVVPGLSLHEELSLLVAAGLTPVEAIAAATRKWAALVLKNGWIVEGTGKRRYRGGVAIQGDRIAAVGVLNGAAARETLDVGGLIVAPGFIDMMGQSEIYALIDNRLFSKITQGVTTE